ncbi:MAG: hypothetical protein WC356_06005 [Candidatus Micrarchaeia archaeon]|jgi:predicted transcriptional regulator
MTEITFISRYKKNNWNDSIKFEFEDNDEKAVFALSQIDDLVFNKCYESLGDLTELDKYIDSLLKDNKNNLIDVFSNIKNKDVNNIFSNFPKEYKPFLEAYLLRKLLEKTKIYSWISKEQTANYKDKPNQTKADSLEYEGIALFIRHKNYFAVRRMSILKDTETGEILQTLVGQYITLYRKAFDFLNLNHKEIDEQAKKITKGKKKGYQNLAELFKTNKELINNPYLLSCVLEILKMYPYIDVDSFNKAFPQFKTKKQKKKR